MASILITTSVEAALTEGSGGGRLAAELTAAFAILENGCRLF